MEDIMDTERPGIVTIGGDPLTLLGPEIKAGMEAPDFKALDKALGEVALGDFKGKIKVISVTPSLDTPICDLQARRFNEEAAALGPDVSVLNISMDLPFAIGRFCEAAGINNVQALSDHRDASFGRAYGVLIKELRLLARAVFVLDREDRVQYVQIVPEVKSHPDYDAAIAAAKALL